MAFIDSGIVDENIDLIKGGDRLAHHPLDLLRVGKIRLVDSGGKTPDMGANEPDVQLRLASNPIFRQNPNGTRSITVFAQWDSSLHNSLLLDRVTAEKYKVQMSIGWEVQGTMSELFGSLHFGLKM